MRNWRRLEALVEQACHKGGTSQEIALTKVSPALLLGVRNRRARSLGMKRSDRRVRR